MAIIQDVSGLSESEAIPVYDRLPGEPEYLYDLFARYVKAVGKRFNRNAIVRAIIHDHPQEYSKIELLAAISEWAWEDRFNRYMSDVLTEDEEVWEEKRKQLRKLDWEIGSDLRQAAVDFLELIEKFKFAGQDENGNTVLAIAVSPSQVVAMSKAASDLQRLAVGEPTAIHSLIVDDIETIRKKRWESVQHAVKEIEGGF